MKKTNPILLILLFAFFLTGCANAQMIPMKTVSAENKREIARELIQNDWNLFAKFSRLNFADRASQNFQPDKASFLTELEDSFYENTPIDLDFSIDQVLIQDNKLAISLTWQKKTADRSTGEVMLKEGEGSIVYIRENDVWRIYQIQGNSIFTF